MTMNALSLLEAPYPYLSKRKFAELPYSQTWAKLLARVEQLNGTEIRRFTADERDTWIVFNYRAYEFCLHDVGAMVQFSVSDFDCPEALLNGVLHHFSKFLSPGMGD